MNYRDECIKMWTYISIHGGSKADYFKVHNIRQHVIYHCFACEEALGIVKGLMGFMCTACPVIWTEQQEEDCVPCHGEKSPYELWEYEPTKENAALVLQTIKETWEV